MAMAAMAVRAAMPVMEALAEQVLPASLARVWV